MTDQPKCPRCGHEACRCQHVPATPPLWTPDELRETARLLSLDEPERVK